MSASTAIADYTPPKKISSTTNDTFLPQMAPDKDGYLHLVWMEADEVWTRPNPGIFYSRWNGDVWSAPLKISDSTTGLTQDPSIAPDSTKVVHVVYTDDTEHGLNFGRIYYTKRELNGSWTTPTQIPHPGTPFNFARRARIAVDTADNLHVVYNLNDDFNHAGSLYYLKYDGTWTTPTLIGYDTDETTVLIEVGHSDIYADKQGDIHVIYWDWDQGIYYRKLSGGSWSTPFLLANAPDVEGPRLTVDDYGNPFVAWYQARDHTVRVRRTESGVWQTEEILTNQGMFNFLGTWPILGITTNSKNIIAVGWGQEGAGGYVDVAYRYYFSGVWSDVDLVRTDTVFADSPYLIRDQWDNQHLVWTEVTLVCEDFLDPACIKWDLWYSVVQGTQQTVGPGGGTVVANPNNVTLVTLDFPSGALASDTLMTVLIGPLPESVDPGVVTVPRAYTFGPSGLTFPGGSYPTVRFDYTDEELKGGDPNTLEVYVWDSQTSSYLAKSGSVNTGQKYLSVTSIDHFSLFAMAAKRVFAEYLEPFQEGMELRRGRSLPFRFKLAYQDGELVPEGEVVVQLKQGETVLKEYSTSDRWWNKVKLNKRRGIYRVLISTRGLDPGEYQLVISRDGPVVGETNFVLIER